MSTKRNMTKYLWLKVKDPDWRAQCTEQLAPANREKLWKMDYSETAQKLIGYFSFFFFQCKRLNLMLEIGLFYWIIFPETGNGSSGHSVKLLISVEEHTITYCSGKEHLFQFRKPGNNTFWVSGNFQWILAEHSSLKAGVVFCNL